MPLVVLYYSIMVQFFHKLGMTEHDYYTVVFAVSRALGCLANGVWSRAFGLPIERPNSIGISYL